MNSENLDKIVALISNSNKKICLFLGAGADISSGGKLFTNIKKDTVAYFSEHDSKILNEHSIEKYFEETIESVPTFKTREILLKEVNSNSNTSISDGYKMLVLLAKYGKIGSIISPNFFDCLERAQQEMGLDVFDSFSNFDNDNMNIPNIYPQKVLYLKLHGDVNRQYVSHITQEEINNKPYPKAIEDMVLKHLKNDLVIFIGYSGFDQVVTNLVKNVYKNMSAVFWINPTYNDQSELVSRLSNNMVWGKYSFDEFIIQLGLKMLHDIRLDAQEPKFIYSWLKAKAQESVINFLHDDRINIERAEYNELKKLSRICIISGKTGIGKTYLIEYYIQQSSKHDILYVDLNYDSSISALSKIITKLGFKTDLPFLLLYGLCTWYSQNKKYLTFIIDGIPDEINKSMEELLSFIDSIKDSNNVSFILSTRGDRVKEKFAATFSENCVHNIEMQPFSLSDIQQMAERYGIQKYMCRISTNYLSDPLICDLTFNCLAKSSQTYNNIFLIIESTIADRLNKHPQIFHDNLIELANAEYQNQIPNNDLVHAISDSELIMEVKPYYFKYDLFKYYYLSLHLFRNNTEKQNSINILIDYFSGGKKYNDLFYNACMMYYTTTDSNTSLIEKIIELNSLLDNCKTPVAIAFCKKCILYFSENHPKELYYAMNETDLSFNEELIKVILEGIQTFEDDELAYGALCLCQKNSDFAYEATIYCIDRFCKKIACQKNEQESNEYFDMYSDIVFSDSDSIKLCKLIYALMRTDLEKKQYPYITNIRKKLYSIASKCSVDEFMDIIRKYSYNILFNSGNDIDADYHSISYMTDLLSIIQIVLDGAAINVEQYIYLMNITDDINNMCVFLLSNLVVMQSMINDKHSTLSIATQIINTGQLSPQNIDFILSSIFMSLYFDNPQGRSEFVKFFENTYDKHEILLFDRPSSIRLSTSKKFSEEFDRIFEDGFNPMAFLFYTSNLECDESRLEQYWTISDQLCQSGNINKILVIVHAVGQMISIFPNEGFKALSKLLKYENHHIIHKGIIRVLQENITRYPSETRKFISENPNIDELDIIQSYVKTKDMLIRSRTLEQLHWSRLLYTFKSSDNDVIKKILRCVTTSKSLSSFITVMLNQGNA